MRNSTKRSVGKLLRVLVAGGVTLAGAVPLAALADDPPAKTDKAAEKASPKPAGADAKKADAKKAEKEKKAPEKKPEEAGGVKGW
jgi:hypothetical protein